MRRATLATATVSATEDGNDLANTIDVSIVVFDDRRVEIVSAPTTLDLAGGNDYMFQYRTNGNLQAVANNYTFQVTPQGAGTVSTSGLSFDNAHTAPVSSFDRGPNIVHAATTGIRAPFDDDGVPPVGFTSPDTTVTGYIAFFFWTAAAAPTGVGDFQGIVNNEFGPRTLTTGNAVATYYLAIPTDSPVFSYNVGGFPVPTEDVILTGVDRNSVSYRVIRFENAQPNSNIVIT